MDYILSGGEVKLIIHNIKHVGINAAINNIIDEMDCTRMMEDFRIIQTINTRYKFLYAAFNYIMNNFDIPNDAKEMYTVMFNKRHNDNLEFEKINGTVIYDKKKRKTTSNRKIATSIRTKDLIDGREVIIPIKKETAKERKLKAKADKLKNGFTFNIAK